MPVRRWITGRQWGAWPGRCQGFRKASIHRFMVLQLAHDPVFELSACRSVILKTLINKASHPYRPTCPLRRTPSYSRANTQLPAVYQCCQMGHKRGFDVGKHHPEGLSRPIWISAHY